ncbi:MAG: AsmA family protein [Gammaproteobacteria bacterium]|nr:AsmA family protein [Gammaproteobacteria bacterium]
MFKRMLIAVLGVVVLAIAGLAVFVASFDANRYKPEIEALAKQYLGRELRLGGELSLTLWPVLGLRAEQVSLGNADGFTDPLFAEAESLVLGVQPLPLLDRRLEVNEVAVNGLKLFLERRKDARTNWQLVPQAPLPQPSAETPAPAGGALGGFGLLLGGISLKQAEVSFRDGVTGEVWRIAPLELTTGRLEPGQPFDLSLAAGIRQVEKKLEGQLRLAGRMRVDPGHPAVEVSGLRLEGDASNLPGKVGRLMFKARTERLSVAGENLALTSAPLALEVRLTNGPVPLELLDAKLNLGLTGDLASGRLRLAPFEGELHAEGEGLGTKGVNARLSGEGVLDRSAGTAQLTLAVDIDGLRASLAGRLEGLKDSPRFAGHLEVADFNPRAWLAAHGRLLHGLPEGSLAQAGAKADVVFADGSLRLGALEAKVDETRAQGSIVVGKGGLGADLALDRLNVDRYLPPKPQTAPTPTKEGGGSPAPGPGGGTPIELPVAMLRDLSGQANLRVAHLTVQRVDVRDLRLVGKARGGDLVIDTLSGQAFDGQFEVRGGLDVRGQAPAWRAAGKAFGVDVGAILQQFAETDRLSGYGELNFDLRTRGASVNALKAGLDGTARARFYDGALKGVNIGQLLRRADAALKGQPAPPPEPVQTDFTELSGSATIANGVIHNTDLDGKSPLLRVQGGGTIDLPRNGIDYGLTVSVVNTATGQTGKGLEQLRGVPIPLKISGSLSDPSYSVDIGKVLEERAKKEVERRVNEELQNRLGLPAPSGSTPQAPDQPIPAIPPVQELLKGLIGR